VSEDLKVGQHVSFLRMHNKAVSVEGTITQINEDGKTVIVQTDINPDILEAAHVDDVTVLETPAEVAADLRSEGIDAKAEPEGIEVNVPKD
jgi:hypothetical protein